MSRLYVEGIVEDVNYLGYKGRVFIICSGNCAGIIHQIIFGDNGYCAYRRISEDSTPSYNTPLYRIDSKAEISRLESRITALENILK